MQKVVVKPVRKVKAQPDKTDEDADVITVRRTPPKPKRPFRVKTVHDARKMLSRIISEFRAGTIKSHDAKTMCYLLSVYVQMYKDTDMDERLEHLEKLARMTR